MRVSSLSFATYFYNAFISLFLRDDTVGQNTRGCSCAVFVMLGVGAEGGFSPVVLSCKLYLFSMFVLLYISLER